jgi:hypothetical protein
MCGYVYNVGSDGGITFAVYELSAWFENKANTDNKAIEGSDNGNDDTRYEVSNKPTIAPATAWGSWSLASGNGVNIVKR